MLAAREHNHGLVPTAPGSRNGIALLLLWLHETERLGFDHRDFSIAAERAKPSAYAVGAGKTSIEKRHAADASVRHAQIGRLRIDPIERKWLQRCFDTQAPRTCNKPLRRLMIDGGPAAVVALAIVSLDQRADALIESVRWRLVYNIHHSMLRPTALMTAAHRSISLTTNLPR